MVIHKNNILQKSTRVLPIPHEKLVPVLLTNLTPCKKKEQGEKKSVNGLKTIMHTKEGPICWSAYF